MIEAETKTVQRFGGQVGESDDAGGLSGEGVDQHEVPVGGIGDDDVVAGGGIAWPMATDGEIVDCPAVGDIPEDEFLASGSEQVVIVEKICEVDRASAELPTSW